MTEHPLTPHFDDETTVASARPVIPIATAKASERSRIPRRMAPLIIAAGIAGTLAGGVIGYYEQRRGGAASSAITQSSAEDASGNQEEVTRSQPKQIAAQANVPSTNSEMAASQEHNVARATDSANTVSALKSTPRFTVHVIRRASMSTPRINARRGAGRIQEIFAGSQP